MLAFLGLGSNLGDRQAHLQQAVASLRGIDPSLEVSPVYETAPVGGTEDQGRYLNCVVKLDADLSPRELLKAAQQLERDAGRVRTTRNAPRTLDVDLLILDDLVLAEDDLVVPHPRLNERAFVLAPLEDLAPHLVPARWRSTVPRSEHLGEDLRLVGRLPDS
ncbi:MAG: 2-amino-4-hydroxy-6-hydroxymethyldihydropteridine diphosphokinase [Acidimicrobiales bacterium]